MMIYQEQADKVTSPQVPLQSSWKPQQETKSQISCWIYSFCWNNLFFSTADSSRKFYEVSSNASILLFAPSKLSHKDNSVFF